PPPPRGGLAPHAGAGSKTSCFVSRYGWRVPRGGPEVKLRWPGSAVLARGRHVERDLTAPIGDPRKPPLRPQAGEKHQTDALAVEIASEIEHVRLDGQLVHAERGPHAHVDDGPGGVPGYEGLADRDAHREPQGAIRPHVGRREAERSAAFGTPDDLAVDRIMAAEQARRAVEVASLYR